MDVSPMGLGVSIRDGGELSPGDRHLVIVEDPKGKTFEALCELRWRSEGPLSTGPYRAGFAFVSILWDDPEGRWAGVAADPTTEPGSSISWPSEIEVADLPADETSPSVPSRSPVGDGDTMPTEDLPDRLSLHDLRRIGRYETPGGTVIRYDGWRKAWFVARAEGEVEIRDEELLEFLEGELRGEADGRRSRQS